jgi:RNA polymerase sigma-70 factor (ECF subfamily)
VNVCRDRLRRSRIVRRIAVADEPLRSQASDPYDQLIRQHDLLAAMDVLDADLRIVVVLRFWADLKVDDIAARLGWPSGTVKSRLHRAIDTMRDALADGARSEAMP